MVIYKPFQFFCILSLVVASEILGSSLLTSFVMAGEKAPGVAFNPMNPHSCYSKCSPWTSNGASLGSLLEMHTVRPTPRLLN